MTAPPLFDTDTRQRVPSAALRSELREAAFNHGYRRESGEADGWLFFASDIDVPGEIALGVSASGSTWFLAVDHTGVAAELGMQLAAPVPPGKRAAFGFAAQSELRAALHRAYNLSCSLPTLPLYEYLKEVAGLGDTEIDRIRKERIGQSCFRAALLRYWEGRCPLSGVSDPELLRASHIVPWAECTSDAERLDVHNGLLLAAHWDAAFDAGLVSFSDDGRAIYCSRISEEARVALGTAAPLRLTVEHREKLAWHRARYAFDEHGETRVN